MMDRINIKLVEQAQASDKEAFSKLVHHYKNTVYSIALSFLGNFAEAEDLTQDVFLRAFLQLHQLQDASKFPQWLSKIAVNQCKMWKRARRETFSYDSLFFSEEQGEGKPLPASLTTPSFTEELERKELQEEVLSAVYALPENNRLVVMLYYLDEMSQKDVAKFLGISETAVETRLYRAKKQLKDEMAKRLEAFLKGQKLSDGFTRKVQKKIYERAEQLIEQSFELSRDDTVVIYHDLGTPPSQAWASLCLQGSDKGHLFVRKSLWGNTVDEAKQKGKQIKIAVEKMQNLFDFGPPDGKMWIEVQKEGTEFYPVHMSRKRFWEKMKSLWRERDEEAYSLLERLLRGEVLLVTTVGDSIDFIRMPSEIAMSRFFRPFAKGEGNNIGLAGSVEMKVDIPPCRNVVFIGDGIINLADIEANVTLFSDGLLFFSAQGIQGTVQAYGCTPIKLEDVSGDVILHNPFYGHSIDIEDKLIHRTAMSSFSKICRIAGALRILCKNLNLDINGVQDSIQIENLFGNTKVYVSADSVESAKFDLRSVSGSISVVLSKEADETMSVGMWTECGTINYRKWGKENILQISNPSIIYAGSLPANNGEDADLKIRTQCGAITIEKE